MFIAFPLLLDRQYRLNKILLKQMVVCYNIITNFKDKSEEKKTKTGY
jgi:hypothetical protein